MPTLRLLSDAARKAINEHLKPETLTERFQFNIEEFSSQVAFRSVELDTGGVLTAQSGEFDKVFHREVIDAAKQKVRYSTEGKVVNENLAKTK